MKFVIKRKLNKRLQDQIDRDAKDFFAKHTAESAQGSDTRAPENNNTVQPDKGNDGASKQQPGAKSVTIEQEIGTSHFVSYAVDQNRSLLYSFILDNGSPVHICNDRSRFSEFNEDKGDYIGTGGGPVPVLGNGTIRVKGKGPNGRLRGLRLTGVLYAPDFPVNIVSAYRLE